jgi:hypothetical protein
MYPISGPITVIPMAASLSVAAAKVSLGEDVSDPAKPVAVASDIVAPDAVWIVLQAVSTARPSRKTVARASQRDNEYRIALAMSLWEMAAHESPRTTKLYDRTKERLMQEKVERIRFYSRCDHRNSSCHMDKLRNVRLAWSS